MAVHAEKGGARQRRQRIPASVIILAIWLLSVSLIGALGVFLSRAL
jgi:hypothetical protein